MKLLQLQEQKGEGHLFIVEIPEWGDIPFKLPSVVRSRQYNAALILSRDEADRIMFYEYIFRECVVDTDLAFNMVDIPAGIVESVAKVILILSGVTEHAIEYTEELMHTFRVGIADTTMTMKRVICSVFSGYTFKELDKLDYQDLAEVFVNAEQMMIEADLIEEPFSFIVSEPKRSGVPNGPLGMAPGRAPNMPDSTDVPVKPGGGIDIDALVADGMKMNREEDRVPIKSEFNLHNDPRYKAKKDAILNKHRE